MEIAFLPFLAIGSAAIGAYQSLAEAAKQSKLRTQAELEAEKAMSQARKDLGKNFFAGLAIQKEPYELQREAMMGTAAQAIEAGRESDRGAAATAGRIFEGAQQGQADIRSQMGQELMGLEEKTATEASRLRDIGVNLSLAEAEGAQQAISDAEKARAQYITSGMDVLQTGIQQGIEALPLYFKNKEGRAADKFEDLSTFYEKMPFDVVNQKFMGEDMITKKSFKDAMAVDYPQVANMSDADFKDFMIKLGPSALKKIKKNLSFFPSNEINPFMKALMGGYQGDIIDYGRSKGWKGFTF